MKDRKWIEDKIIFYKKDIIATKELEEELFIEGSTQDELRCLVISRQNALDKIKLLEEILKD